MPGREGRIFTFGTGDSHYCLGANLARAEIRIAIDAIVRSGFTLSRVPGVAYDFDGASNFLFHGPDHVLVNSVPHQLETPHAYLDLMGHSIADSVLTRAAGPAAGATPVSVA